MVDRPGYALGRLSPGSCGRSRRHTIDGVECDSSGGNRRWPRRGASRNQQGQSSDRHEHRQPRCEPHSCFESARKRRRYGGCACIWKRNNAPARPLVGDGWRAPGDLCTGQDSARRYRTQGYLRRRERTRPVDEDCDELKSRGSDARVLRGRVACREERDFARDRRGRSDAQRHRVADGPVSRAFRSQHAERGLVQREHDAEGHDAGARTGSSGRCPIANNGGDQRTSHGRSGYGPSRPRFCGSVRSLGPHVGGCQVWSREMTIVAGRSQAEAKTAVEQWIRMYRRMVSIRLFEEQVNDLYTRALMPGLAHLYMGEEAVAVGICETLRSDDYITSTHRGHGHCLAKGASPDRMFAELLGKEAGYCRGKGVSMHIADPATGNLGANAIVAGSAGIATGAAFAAKRLGNGRLCVCFFGEGALGQGVLYEVMNMAELWKLPVIYVCENNLYNEYTHYSETTSGEILARPAAFGIPAESVDGQDVQAVYGAAARLVERARRGDGPAFLLCNTYRFRGPHVGDINRAYYRSKQEEQQWMGERDPIKMLADWLIAQGSADRAVLDRIDREVKSEIDAAVQFALAAPYPGPEEVDQDIYA